MVHHKLHSILVSVLVESIDVKVRVRGNKVKDIVLVAVCPVFPAFVPAFHKHLVEAVLSCEVDVTADLLVVCRVEAVRGCL